MYQKRTPSTVSLSVISTCCPVGSVIWYVALAPESTSRYRHRLKTSIGTQTLCGCIRRMASFALAWRSLPRQRGYSVHPRIAGLEARGVCDPANGDYEQNRDPAPSRYDRRAAGKLVAGPRCGESYRPKPSQSVVWRFGRRTRRRRCRQSTGRGANCESCLEVGLKAASVERALRNGRVIRGRAVVLP